MTVEATRRAGIFARRISDLLLFAVTLAELVILVLLTPSFTLVDWIYVVQNLLVLLIALTRRAPAMQDRSLASGIAVAVSCIYPYSQVICLQWAGGHVVWPTAGRVLVTVAACLSLASLISIGRFFGLRPAARGLATMGPYGFVRHPMYLAYFISDIGYQLHEWNVGTLLIVLAGWTSLIYRIRAEDKVLSSITGWSAYASAVPRRLISGNLVAAVELERDGRPGSNYPAPPRWF